MPTTFSDSYGDLCAGLASKDFSSDKEWQAIVTRARKVAQANGFSAGEASVLDDLRKLLAKANGQGTNEAVSLLRGAGENLSGKGPGVLIDADLSKRLGALKTFRHTYFVKKSGGHKVWILGVPKSFVDWPVWDLKGGLGAVTAKLNDVDERFTVEQRKDLKDASQEALKWVHKAMTVAGDPKKKGNFEKVARWFADENSKDNDMVAAASTLNAGLKKFASVLKSGHLLYTDNVSYRGDPLEDSEAFVWYDNLDVIYIEKQFFGTNNTLTGLTNWARVVVHEISHREVKTKDHAYEWQGMAPRKLKAAKALENADSWAWFCADCAGALTDSLIQNALARP